MEGGLLTFAWGFGNQNKVSLFYFHFFPCLQTCTFPQGLDGVWLAELGNCDSQQGLWGLTPWVSIQALPLDSCVILDKILSSLSLSVLIWKMG